MKITILDQLSALDLKNFHVETLQIESDCLKGNSLKDPTLRRNPVLIPKDAEGPLPVVWILAGLMGNGPDSFSPRFGELNTAQNIDHAVSAKKAPHALYVFADAMTSWGGSQFINSAQGRYEDYLMKELVLAVQQCYDVSPHAKHWCVTGGSSGGYGALHLGSKFPETFGMVAALAPDCFFEASLLPEYYKALNEWNQFGGPKGLLKELQSGRLKKNKNFGPIVNAVGMSLCYADGALPIDSYTGVRNPAVWKKFQEKDPLVFLPKRLVGLKKLTALYIDVGNKDQFDLHLGCRQLHQWLKTKKIKHHYNEFNGTHFDLAPRRLDVWVWLHKAWGK
ncbi:MAG: enterochelin esterase [Bdellovibrionales bacterium]|nr:enterochelin esterase [Bdellovibrionales bacterium]